MCFFYRDVQNGSAIDPVYMTTLQGAEGGNPQQESVNSYLNPRDLSDQPPPLPPYNTQSVQSSVEPDPLPY